jgi:hypothetical protein
MELILEALWLCLEVVFQALFSDEMENVFDFLDWVPGDRFLVCVAAIAVGFTLGAASSLLLPHRLLPPPETRGLSLVLSPIGSGLAMSLCGAHRQGQGRAPSFLASFWGGASFAFGCALGRFVAIA